jgi:hypothetical protein
MNFRASKTWWASRLAGRDREGGVALISVLIVMAILTALGSTVALVGVDNLKNANRDRQAGASIGAGDAGVAMAIEYIRSNGVGGLACLESNTGACPTTAGWNSPTSPMQVPLDSAGTGCTTNNNCARVWIGVVQQYAPPAVKVGIYNIHSEGIFGSGPSARQIVSTVQVTPDKFPIGVFGQSLSGNGGTHISTESLFTTQCVTSVYDGTGGGSGGGTHFVGIDSYWAEPAAAHSTSHVTTSNNSCTNNFVPSTTPAASNVASNTHCANNTALNIHQSQEGGLVSSAAGSACYHQYQRPDGSWYPDGGCPSGVTSTRSDGLCDTTAFTTADLQRYGYRPRGLSSQQYSALEDRAKAIGTYNVSTGQLAAKITAAVAAGINDPVVYWDCSQASSNCPTASGLRASDISSTMFNSAPVSSGGCANPYRIVTVVLEHGDLTFQSGNSSWFDGAFFVPDGNFNGNGGYNVVGTLFSKNLDMGGNQNWSLDSCWVTNFPGAVISITQTGFREDDATDAP